jgi:hypothetical protein
LDNGSFTIAVICDFCVSTLRCIISARAGPQANANPAAVKVTIHRDEKRLFIFSPPTEQRRTIATPPAAYTTAQPTFTAKR